MLTPIVGGAVGGDATGVVTGADGADESAVVGDDPAVVGDEPGADGDEPGTSGAELGVNVVGEAAGWEIEGAGATVTPVRTLMMSRIIISHILNRYKMN